MSSVTLGELLRLTLRGPLSPRWIAMWICLLSLGLASPVLGQMNCGRGKTRDPKICKSAKRDVRGCCKIPKRKRRKAKRKACLPGQVKTAETNNQCCYPGQYWSRRKRKGMGAPECPSDLGMVAIGSGCGCPEGQVIGQYTSGHCCWEGQEWVVGRGCVGELSAEQRGLQVKLAEAKRARVRAKRVGIKFIKIPGGSFNMGSDRRPYSKPMHQVTVSAFEMSESEVTVGQYRKCVSAGVCTNPKTGGSCNWGKSGREDHPVNCVDWGQARTFARWVGGDLPTEAQWEYSARGGGREVKYPWGNAEASCSYAVMGNGDWGCGRDSTWPVCSKRQGDTPQGLCDMAGNVEEWTLDEWHNNYNGAPSSGDQAWGNLPTCSTVCDKGSPRRVSRGGRWDCDASVLRVAYRGSSTPGDRGYYRGFRVRRTLP